MSKRDLAMGKNIEKSKRYTLAQAVDIVKKNATAKFDETVEMHVNLGVDPKKTDQTVRGSAVLPKGSGQKRIVAVIAKGEKVKEAQAAGADHIGDADLIEKISKGWFDFDVLVATPDMMKDLTKLGKLLGPRGLMPTPKSGTVTFDIERTVKELKAGRIEFKLDDTANLHTIIGKASFAAGDLLENAQALLNAINAAKPPTAKGIYIRSITLTSTMGKGVRVAQESPA
ncbi:MAG: 50S ribosomal protein L1 [Elusimicrobia bacterium]|nr:50S ribosomal protein L1 [Candidatus Obscuribacterium magneticum]